MVVEKVVEEPVQPKKEEVVSAEKVEVAPKKAEKLTFKEETTGAKPEKEPETEPQENISESKYSVTELCPHIDIGHDGGTLFSGGKLYISATVHRDENSCDEILIIDLENGGSSSFGLYLLYDVDCFTDDFNGNVYHLISENGSDLEGDYVYSLISLNENGNTGNSINLHLGDDFGIEDITCIRNLGKTDNLDRN